MHLWQTPLVPVGIAGLIIGMLPFHAPVGIPVAVQVEQVLVLLQEVTVTVALYSGSIIMAEYGWGLPDGGGEGMGMDEDGETSIPSMAMEGEGILVNPEEAGIIEGIPIMDEDFWGAGAMT